MMYSCGKGIKIATSFFFVICIVKIVTIEGRAINYRSLGEIMGDIFIIPDK